MSQQQLQYQSVQESLHCQHQQDSCGSVGEGGVFEVSAPRSDLILFEPVSSTALSLMAMQAADTCPRQARGTENSC